MSEPVTGVDLIPIESQTRTIQTCFQQCLYEVPIFQRPYSWTEDQLDDYWRDVILAQGDFFFGSTVTWVSQRRDLFHDTYSIIDGQQRLTTSAIILSVIRDAFLQIEDLATKDGAPADSTVAKNQAEATQKYLLSFDDDGNQYKILTRPEPMFYEKIQNPSAIPSGVKWNGSAEKIGLARTFFERKILQELDNSSNGEKIDRLKLIRSNVLKARIIQVELATEEDGFLIFETLNTRGSDLRLSDLAKNLMIRGGATETFDREAIAKRWVRVVDRVEETTTNIDAVDRFIWLSWNSRRGLNKESELYKAIGLLIGSDPQAHLSYLEELESDSETYECFDDETLQVQPLGKGARSALEVPEFVDSVRALAVFKVSVAYSTVLAVARKYQESRVSRRQLIKVMRLVENFHFQFSALANSGSTGGTRGRYNRFAVMLEEAKNSQQVEKAIDDLTKKLRASLPKSDLVKNAFQELFYAPSLKLNQAQKVRARKVFIAYVLTAFAKSKGLMPRGQDPQSWTIEHIKPQTLGGEDLKNPVYSIGNLTLLTTMLNGELGAAAFSVKLEKLQEGSAYFDAELKSWSKIKTEFPTDEQIKARAARLAQEALDTVWKV